MTKQFNLFADTDELQSDNYVNSNTKLRRENGNSASSSVREIELSDFYDGKLVYVKNWLSSSDADKTYKLLYETLAWQQDKIRLYGKWVTIPRMQAWYGDADALYQYSGIEMRPLTWTDKLMSLRQLCESFCKVSFNSVLANLYRSGADSMGMHSDDEPELGPQPVIASLTLGESRRFDFKHKKDKTKLHIHLEHGSLLVMKGDTQRYWQHGIQKTKKQVSERINLTFRNIKVSDR